MRKPGAQQRPGSQDVLVRSSTSHGALFVAVGAPALPSIDCAGMLPDAVRPNLDPVGDKDAADDHYDRADNLDCVCEHAIIGKVVNAHVAEPSDEIAHSSSSLSVPVRQRTTRRYCTISMPTIPASL